ncbi:MAG: hypothetical protein WC346_09980 [Methanogenium sp.]|jgi:hypothetical protein
MKLFSRSNVYLVVLENGIPANRMAGVAGKTTRYIKFEGGEANVDDDDTTTIELYKKHPKYGLEFFEENEDPFKVSRKASEPRHAIDEIEHGVAGKSIVSKGTPSEQERLILEKATEIAKVMAGAIIKEMLEKNNVSYGSSPTVSESTTKASTAQKANSSYNPKKYTYNGEMVTLNEAAEKSGVDYGKLLHLTRFKKMSVDDAVAQLKQT